MPVPKTVVIIAGPTAVGKTAVAIEVAKHFGTEIISADSRQCYKELDIGVARPSPAELAQVPHHFIANHSVSEKVTAVTFEKEALQTVHGLLKKLDVVVLAGGTGLYIKAFCEGLDVIPDVPEEIHYAVAQEHKLHGLAWLQHEVELVDPHFFSEVDINNPHRLLRALEVFRATAQPFSSFRTGTKKQRPFRILKTALQVSKEQLHLNIDRRVDAMMMAGLIDEVKGLQNYKNLLALQTVGYAEIFQYLDGKLTKEEVVAAIKTHTRQYAKRQLTWFRKDAAFRWFEPDANMLIEYLDL